MRVNSMFHALVAIVALLTFSTPFLTFAQQNATYAAARDATSIKFAAARDASRDVRILFNMIPGLYGLEDSDIIAMVFCLSCANGGIIGAGIGCIAGAIHGNPGEKTEAMLIGTTLGGIIGSIVYGAALIAGVWPNQTGSPPPLPNRFMGKSPEYVQAYTDAYRVKTRALRKR